MSSIIRCWTIKSRMVGILSIPRPRRVQILGTYVQFYLLTMLKTTKQVTKIYYKLNSKAIVVTEASYLQL